MKRPRWGRIKLPKARTMELVKNGAIPIDPELLHARVKDARLKLVGRNVQDLLEGIELKDRGDKGPAYERGNVYAIKYAAEKIPQDSTILADSSRLLDLLRVLYEQSPIADEKAESAAYLLAWNPENWTWTSLRELAARFRAGEALQLRIGIAVRLQGSAQQRVELRVAGIERVDGHAQVHLDQLRRRRRRGPLERVRHARRGVGLVAHQLHRCQLQ